METAYQKPTYKAELGSFLRDYFSCGANQSSTFCSLTHLASTAEKIILESKGNKLSQKQEEYLESLAQKIKAYIDAGRQFSDRRPELIDLYRETRDLLVSYPDRKDRALTTLQGYHTQRLEDLAQPHKVIYSVHVQGLVKAIEALEKRNMPVQELKARAVELEKDYWKVFNQAKNSARVNSQTQNTTPTLNPTTETAEDVLD